MTRALALVSLLLLTACLPLRYAPNAGDSQDQQQQDLQDQQDELDRLQIENQQLENELERQRAINNYNFVNPDAPID
jgi:hypothetical protein